MVEYFSVTMNADEDIEICTMTVKDYEEVKSFLRDQFYTGEPLTMSSEENVEKCDEKNIDDYNLSLIKQGTSLKAVERSTGRIVGLVLAGAQYPSDLEKHRKEAEEMPDHIWGRIVRFLSKAESEANIFEKYGVEKALYSHITNVDASMRGKGLGSRLAEALMNAGRAKGFPLMFALCTSFYSARQKEALGMECAYSKLYSEYKDEQGKVVFRPAAPHTQMRLMVIRL